MAACSGTPTGTSKVTPGGPCSPSGTVSLSVNEGTTIDCTNGSQVTVAGSGAVYLVVPQFAAGDVSYLFQDYTLNLAGPGSPGGAARLRAVSPPSVSAARMQGGSPLGLSSHAFQTVNRRQTQFDLKMLAAGRKRALSGQMSAPRGGVKFNPLINCTIAIGQTCQFYVISDDAGTTYTTVTATLKYIGSNVYVYIDNNAPVPGFSGASLTSFSQYADQFLYPLDVNTFGAPTNIDGLGHVIMLLTPVVNQLTTKATCASEGFVAGFFDSADLDGGGPPSNNGEIFYQIVPDSAGVFSCAHTVSEIEGLTPGVFLHELQHMINHGHHVIINHGLPEEGWLDEGESIVATELGARYYQAKYPYPGGRTNLSQYFPDSAENFISEQLLDSYTYLSLPDTASVTLHTDADCCLAWRAGDWLLLRYLGDQYDSTFYAHLENGMVTGTANLAQAAGISFQQLFGNWGIALFTDSLVGLPRTSVPSVYRYTTPHNLRAYYQALYNVAGGQYGVTQPFPITLSALNGSGNVSSSMVPGTNSFYELTTPSGSSTVTLDFGPPGGGTFSSILHAQVNVYRLQ
jgi:hypothetical protein